VGNLFDNELLVVIILHRILSMATTYAHFLERTCNRYYILTNITKDDRTYYRTMALFIFSGQLLERANTKRNNPKMSGIRNILVFSGGCGQVWLLILVCYELTYVRREYLGSRKCRLSTSGAGKGEKQEGKEQDALDEEDNRDEDDSPPGDLT
jgi:hypothetical protein